MLPDMKHTILINTKVKLYSWPLNFSQGSAATDLRKGDSFNSNFLHKPVMNLTVKNCENWYTFA